MINSTNKFHGLNVIIAPKCPRYVLPEEVMPGIPWPAGFREEFNAWSKEVCGSVSSVPEGGNPHSRHDQCLHASLYLFRLIERAR